METKFFTTNGESWTEREFKIEDFRLHDDDEFAIDRYAGAMAEIEAQQEAEMESNPNQYCENRLEIGDKVIFQYEKKYFCQIGKGEAIGEIKDFDGDFVIIETGAGEVYIHKNKVLKNRKNAKKK